MQGLAQVDGLDHQTEADRLAAGHDLLGDHARHIFVGLRSLGAIVLHLSPWLGIQLEQGPAVSQALAQGRSAAEIAALGLPTDKGALFLLCLAIAVLAAGTFLVEKAKVRAMTTKKVKKPVGAFA